ncbi:MAG TPA: Tol-Pal system beta propeller repeat protein TolB [Gallionellaceae bacterium]|nr:Tol-Pal system beta propeller repeat protein TolB [Gallionellaceae bacterium]
MVLRNIIFVFLVLVAYPVQAALDIEITGAGEHQIPISIVAFAGEEKLTQKISAVIASDLKRSGLFRLVDHAGKAPHEMRDVSFGDWAEVDALTIGSATVLADGRVEVKFRLLDTHKQSQLLGQSVVSKGDQARAIAHRIADMIYEKFTGDAGVFSTRIAYINREGKVNRLVVADSDGYGEQSILTLKEPIMSPAWSPDGSHLAYVTFEQGRAVTYVQSLFTRQRFALAAFPGSNSAPAWAPDGKQLAIVLTRDGTSAIYLVRPDGTGLRRISYSDAIDTEPSFSPDGRFLLFASDRGGTVQIYRMPAEGGYAERMTFEGNNNFSPRYSPDGNNFVFMHSTGGQFYIATQDFQTRQMQVLTDVGWEKKPSFAPNGKIVLFATESLGRGILATVSSDGRVKQKMIPQQGDIREPMWGPFLK